MRQIVVTFVVLAAVAAPAAALAQATATGDGSLVVRNGEAPAGVPVVALRITGSVIGHIDYGRIVIDAGSSSDAVPQVIGAGRPGDWTKSDTAQVWPASGKALDVNFRAVSGTFTVVVWGSGVSLVAAGSGSVRLVGLPDTPHGDGQYSLNDADFTSLPGTQTPRLLIGNG
ncbi:MAG: hypothetical protein QOD48_984 [Gaiellaceae bacterium]|jgi:hypothetical protein|nr:hypothetical protein [Gaiellaceae bacterium]